MSTEYWQCNPAEEVHFHYPVSVFSKLACRWKNDSRVTTWISKGSWCSIRMYHFRQLCGCRVFVSELWGFQWGYRVSLHRNRKSVKNQRANQLMSRSLVLRLFCSQMVNNTLQPICIFRIENKFVKISICTSMTKYVLNSMDNSFEYISFGF